MTGRVLDRRRFARVPMSGSMRWRSGEHTGYCEVVDLSPCGAAFLIPQSDVDRLGESVSLMMQITQHAQWSVTEGARIVRVMPQNADKCCVGVEFPAGQAHDP